MRLITGQALWGPLGGTPINVQSVFSTGSTDPIVIPVIQGLKGGIALTGSALTFDPPGGDLTIDGSPVAGWNGGPYTPLESDVGSTISYAIGGRKSSAVITLPEVTQAEILGLFDGIAMVGESLTFIPTGGTLALAGDTVADWNGGPYIPTDADRGLQITYTVGDQIVSTYVEDEVVIEPPKTGDNQVVTYTGEAMLVTSDTSAWQQGSDDVDTDGVWMMALYDNFGSGTGEQVVGSAKANSNADYLSLNQQKVRIRDSGTSDLGETYSPAGMGIYLVGSHTYHSDNRTRGKHYQDGTWSSEADYGGGARVSDMARFGGPGLPQSSTLYRGDKLNIFAMARGTGDPSNFLDWIYNGGDFRKPSDYDFASDPLLLTHDVHILTRNDQSGDPLPPVGLTKLGDGSIEWTNITVPWSSAPVTDPETDPVPASSIGFNERTETTVSYYGDTVTFAEPTLVTQHVGGAFYVPAGTVIQSRSVPDVAGQHGIVRNPTFDTDDEAQGFDNRMGSYRATLRETLPLTVAENDVIWLATSGADEDRGGTIERYMVVHSSPVKPTAISPEPTLVRPVGLPALSIGPNIDYVGRFSTIPTFTVSSPNRPSNIAAMIYGARTDAGHLLTDQSSGSGGYEHLMLKGSSNSDGGNYGRHQAMAESDTLMALFDNSYPEAERLDLYVALANWGLRTVNSGLAAGGAFRADGGHGQFWQAKCLIGLHAANMLGDTPLHNWLLGNNGWGNYKSARKVDQAFLDNCVPHNDFDKPRAWHIRDVVEILSPTQMTVRGRDDLQASYEGLPVKATVGGAESVVTSMVGHDGKNNINGSALIRLTVESTAGFSVGDDVYFDWYTEHGAPAVGDYVWRDKGQDKRFSPSKSTGYHGLQLWLPTYLLQLGLGAQTLHENDEAFHGYMKASATDSSILKMDNNMRQYARDFSDQHRTAFEALPQPLLN